MRGDIVSELRLAALYANQVAHAIVLMDDRLSNCFFNAMRSTHNTFAIDRSIDVLGTPAITHLLIHILMRHVNTRSSERTGGNPYLLTT